MARNQNVTQFRVNTQATFRDTQNIEEIALFDSNGNVLTIPGKATTVAAIATANATDLATSEALANQTKTTVNAILAALKAAGLMA